MSVAVEKLEKNMAKLTIEVSAEELEKAIQGAYQKQKNRINIPGFRKGKAPRKMIEKMYGAGVFYEDAANALIPEAYSKALDECEETIVSQPSIAVTQLESGKPFIFTAEVALKPEVTLGEYKGLEVPKADLEVTEEEIAGELRKEQEENSRVLDVDDRAVADGDKVTLDFEGFVDGEAFDGGKGTDYPLTIGSGSFIPGFEEQLVGANIGEEKEVNVTFPEDYQAKELAGKAAVFKVKVHEIKKKELPEINDEFAQDVSEFDTLDEYKEDVKKGIAEQKEKAVRQEKQEKIIRQIVENAEMDIPDPMVITQTRQMMDQFAQQMQSNGLSMAQYYQFTGLTPDGLLEQMKPQAQKNIENRLVLEAIAAAEGIAASEEEVEKEFANIAERYGLEVEKVKEIFADEETESIKSDIAAQKALELITDAAVEVPVTEVEATVEDAE